MEGVLDTILTKESVKTAKDTKQLLAKLVGVQTQILEVEKERLKEEKKNERAEQRREADRKKLKKAPSAVIKKEEKEEKKKGKGLLGTIMSGLGSLFTATGLGKLLLKAGLATALAAGVHQLLTNRELRESIINGLFGKNGIFGPENRRAMIENLFSKDGLFGENSRRELLKQLREMFFGKKGIFTSIEGFASAITALTVLLGPKNMFKLVTSLIGVTISLTKAFTGLALKVGSKGFAGLLSKLGIGGGAAKVIGGGGAAKVTTGAGTALAAKSAAAGGALKVGGLVLAPLALAASAGLISDKVRQNMAGGGDVGELSLALEEELSEVRKSNRTYRSVRDQKGTKTREYTPEELERMETLKNVQAEVRKLIEERDKAIDGAYDYTLGGKRKKTKIQTEDSKAKQEAIRVEFDEKAVKLLEGLNLEEREGLTARKTEKMFGYQTGGFVGRVPDMGGDGDRFPAMLQTGSVVLNQTAAGYQSGGLVPALLERGEQVYGPNDPNRGAALMMNSMIPRFMEGGEVKDIKKKKDPKPGSKEAQGNTEVKQTSDPEVTEGPITPGGHIDFIGDGSGFTGELKFTDGAGKVVGSWGGISGQIATKNSSQTDRRNISGANMPIPDGDYPIESPMGPGSGGGVGKWAAWVNNPSGTIANRSQIFLHSDVGHTGTAGCIGVMTDGVPGSQADMSFPSFYDSVMPKRVKVNLAASGGKKFAVGELGTKGDTGTAASQMQSMLGDTAAFAGGLGMAMLPVVQKLIGAIGNMFKGVGAGIFGDALSGMFSLATGGAGLGGMFNMGGDSEYGSQPPAQPGGEFGESALIKAMDEAGMVNKKERAAFLAQMAHETGNFNYDEEIASGAAYEGRSDLGNTQPGDGKRYKGRGYIQLTGRANYKQYGDAIGQDLVNNPELAKDPNIAAQVAIEYWRDRGLPALSQAGNFDAVTYRINGGYNGKADRDQKYAQYLAKGYQEGGVANMRGGSAYSSNMVTKSQDDFAKKIAAAASPVIIPMPMGGGGGGGQTVPQGGDTTPFPTIPGGDTSVVGSEYKLNFLRRMTMGASV